MLMLLHHKMQLKLAEKMELDTFSIHQKSHILIFPMSMRSMPARKSALA